MSKESRTRPSSVAAVLRTILPPPQRRWHSVVFLIVVLLCADTLFLLAHRGMGELHGWMGWGRIPSHFYQATALLHSALGYLLTLSLMVFVGLHVPEVLRRLRRRWLVALTGLVILGAFGFLLYSGTFFLLHSKTAGNAWLYVGHMSLSAAFLLIYFGHRALAAGGFPRWQVTGLLAAAASVAVVMIVAELADVAASSARVGAETAKVPLPPATDAVGFAPASGLNPAAPFFPSPVAMASGARQIDTHAIIGASNPGMEEDVRSEVERNGYARERLIGAEGCARCHADIVAQWQTSAHRFSSFNNPFYAASVELLRKNDSPPNAFVKRHMEIFGYKDVRSGQIKSQWCGGCHDPALMFDGKMRAEIDRTDVKAQAGLTCLACHQIKDVPGHTGSGNYVWDDEFKDPYLFNDSDNQFATEIHDLYLKANPEQHKQDMLKPIFRTSEFCASCHKVSLEPPLNEYHFVRGQDEYDNWHNSGAPLNAARTFYQPKQRSECQTCHMPLEPATLGDVAAKNGMVLSHRFVAVNTALPFLRGDQATIERAAQFLHGKLRISFAGLRAGDKVALTTEAPQATLEVGADDAPELDVVVRNLGVGHTFPGGTNDSNEAWIEVTVQDGSGRSLLKTGRIDESGRLPENTRIYNTVFIDRFSNRIAKRNAQDIAALVYAAVIPPSSSDLARFRIPLEALPADGQKMKVTARLLWRKFNREFSDFAREAEPKAFQDVSPDLPVTEIASANGELSVERTEHGATLTMRSEPAAPAGQRHLLTHDYGIALLLQGDTAIARTVLEGLVARAPDCANCLRTLARLHLADRDYAAARAALLEHEKRWPGDAQAAWLWAGVLRGEGQDAEAVKALNRVIEVYPLDREAWHMMEEIEYRSGHYQAAAAAAGKLIEIDPEDATAHYYCMLAKRSLGDEQGARVEQAAYVYYQRDESAQQMTLDFRQREPASNFAAQPIKVYTLQ